MIQEQRLLEQTAQAAAKSTAEKENTKIVVEKARAILDKVSKSVTA